MTPRSRDGHESVDRALRVIEQLGTSGSGYTLEELAAATAIPKTTLHRTLAALKARGFAAQPRAGGAYTLGPQLLAVAFGFHERLDVRGLVHPLLVRARDDFGETVHMGVLDGADVVYLDKVESLKPLKMTSIIGGRNPAHATALGKALLAWSLPDDDAVAAWAQANGPLPARTPNTIVDPAQLAETLAQVRQRGWALEYEESEPGVRCLAVPVFLGRAEPAAAISVAGPKQRLDDRHVREIAPALRAIADTAFGAPPSA